MNGSRIARWGGAAGLLAGLWWLGLTPFMATVGFCQGACDTWADKPLVIRTAGQWLAGLGAFSGASGDQLYFRYGRLFVIVYLLLIQGLVAFQALQRSRLGAAAAWLRPSYRFLLMTMSLAALGDFLSYGVGMVSEAAWRYGFLAEMLSLLLVGAGSVWYGVATRRAEAVPPWTALLLVLAGIGLVAMLFDRWLIMYLPNAPTLPLAAAWFALGIHMSVASSRPRPAGERVPPEDHPVR